jgi:hypothetical protein
MREIDSFRPFDTQRLQPTDWYEMAEMKRAINMLVEEVKLLRKSLS